MLNPRLCLKAAQLSREFLRELRWTRTQTRMLEVAKREWQLPEGPSGSGRESALPGDSLLYT